MKDKNKNPQLKMSGPRPTFRNNIVDGVGIDISGEDADVDNNFFTDTRNRISKLWSETWWGKITIGVIIVAIGLAIERYWFN